MAAAGARLPRPPPRAAAAAEPPAAAALPRRTVVAARLPRPPPRAAAAAEPPAAAAPPTPQRCIVVLPGLGNNAADYAPLAAALRARGLAAAVAPVGRADWARNAAGLLDAAYWRGTLKPRPTVDWYLERAAAALAAARAAAAPGARVSLLAHSAGGWLGRLFMLECLGAEGGPEGAGIDRFVSLGSPHAPPPVGVADQTRGILTHLAAACPGAFHAGVAYTTVASRLVRGAPLGGPGPLRDRVVGLGYAAVCGAADVWGDGVVPVPAAHLDGAAQVTLDGVAHSPLGLPRGGGDADDGEGEGGGEEGAGAGGGEGAAAGGGAGRPPRARRGVWYGSEPVLPLWAPGALWGDGDVV